MWLTFSVAVFDGVPRTTRWQDRRSLARLACRRGRHPGRQQLGCLRLPPARSCAARPLIAGASRVDLMARPAYKAVALVPATRFSGLATSRSPAGALRRHLAGDPTPSLPSPGGCYAVPTHGAGSLVAAGILSHHSSWFGRNAGKADGSGRASPRDADCWWYRAELMVFFASLGAK